MLAALFLAVGVTVAGASLLLALRRGPARTTPASTPSPLKIPTAPAPLAPDPQFARVATPATTERPAPIVSSVVIHLHSLPAGSRTATMGVATFDATNGSGFVWTPLTAANEQADGSLLLRTTVHDTSEQSVTFATDRAFARHGYLARSRFVPDRRTGEVAVSLDATSNQIRFELPPTAVRAGPLRIVRLDDPTWMPMEHGTTGLSVTGGVPTKVLFGAGEYELQDPLAPERSQRFVVPASGPVVLNPTLTVVRAGRP